MDLFERVANVHGVSPEEVQNGIREAAASIGLDVEPEAFVHFLAQLVRNQGDVRDVSDDV